MSQSNNSPKIISHFTINFDDQTKAEIAGLKDKLDAVANALNEHKPTGGLLAVMASNDAEMMKLDYGLGQWVFEAEPEEWISAAWDGNGEVWLFNVPSCDLKSLTYDGIIVWDNPEAEKAQVCSSIGTYHHDDMKHRNLLVIDREPVNDVDYLSDRQDFEAQVLDGSDITPTTPSNSQLFFIKNLSSVLIQRMHAMNRFSGNEWAISADDIQPFDIVVGKPYASADKRTERVRYGIVVCVNRKNNDHEYPHIEVLSLNESHHGIRGETNVIYFSDNSTYRNITRSELKDFNAALEACYG